MPATPITLFDPARIPDPAREETFHADATYVFDHLSGEVVPKINANIEWMEGALVGDTETILDSLAALNQGGHLGEIAALNPTVKQIIRRGADGWEAISGVHVVNITPIAEATTYTTTSTTAYGSGGQASYAPVRDDSKLLVLSTHYVDVVGPAATGSDAGIVTQLRYWNGAEYQTVGLAQVTLTINAQAQAAIRANVPHFTVLTQAMRRPDAAGNPWLVRLGFRANYAGNIAETFNSQFILVEYIEP